MKSSTDVTTGSGRDWRIRIRNRMMPMLLPGVI